MRALALTPFFAPFGAASLVSTEELANVEGDAVRAFVATDSLSQTCIVCLNETSLGFVTGSLAESSTFCGVGVQDG